MIVYRRSSYTTCGSYTSYGSEGISPSLWLINFVPVQAEVPKLLTRLRIYVLGKGFCLRRTNFQCVDRMKISMHDGNIRGVTIVGLELSVDDSNVTTDDLLFALKRRSITGPVVSIDAGNTSVQQIMDECLLLLVDGLSLGNQAQGADGPE